MPLYILHAENQQAQQRRYLASYLVQGSFCNMQYRLTLCSYISHIASSIGQGII